MYREIRRVFTFHALLAAFGLVVHAASDAPMEGEIHKRIGPCVAELKIEWLEEDLEDIHRATAAWRRTKEFQAKQIPLAAIYFGTIEDPRYYIHYESDCDRARQFTSVIAGVFERYGRLDSYEITILSD